MQPYTLIPSNGSEPADEWIRLGVQAHTEGKLDKAEENYRHALRLDPRNVIATQNLAVALASRGNLNEALLTAERAALMDGDTTLVHANRALIALEADRIDESLESAERALAISANAPKVEFPDGGVQALFVKALIAATAGKPTESLEAYEEILSREPLHPAAGPNSCFIQTLLDTAPDALAAYRRRYAAAHRPKDMPARYYPNDRNPDRALRVGYVGGDFKTHSAAMIFGNVILNHSPAVEHYIYSSLPVNGEQDLMTRRFFVSTKNTERWRDIVPLNDDQAAEKVREDRIDILVDLAAHTGGGRLGVFFHRPAPVQVTAWGFAHGTGMEEIDYFFADPVAVPESERIHYAEKVIDLPCVVSYLPPPYGLRGTSAAPFASRGYFTFGSYARYEKLSDECLQAFAEILRRVPDSVLQFKDHAFRRPYSIRRVLSFMEDIDPKRLSFSISTNHPEHMLAYQQCDLCLDPWPHGGGVVFLEQMYMGVPTLTLRGKQPSGRTGASVLTLLNRPEWIAESPEDYVEKAAHFATSDYEHEDTNDAPYIGGKWSTIRDLIAARKTLREEFLKSPVVAGYPQAVEAVYRMLWQEWCRK